MKVPSKRTKLLLAGIIGIGLIVLFALNIRLFNSVGGETASIPEIDSGFVFLDGQYIPSPYNLIIRDGDIILNGQIMSVIPPFPDPDPPESEALADPQTAEEVLASAVAWLSKNQFDEEQFATHIQSFPSVAELDISATSYTVTDRDGGQANLKINFSAPPTIDEIIEDQVELMESWVSLLDSGGVLLVIPGGSVEIPPWEARQFLTDLIAIFDQPENERLKLLEESVDILELAAAFLDVGQPPVILLDRLPPPSLDDETNIQPLPRGSGLLSAPLPIPYWDDKSHQNSRTPKTNRAYIFNVLSSTREIKPVVQAARLHGYRVIIYKRSWPGPGTATIDNFYATTDKAGILYIDSHGGKDGVCIEQWAFESSSKKAYDNYLASGRYTGLHIDRSLVASTVINIDLGLVSEALSGLYNAHHVICARDRGIRDRWKDAQTIVMIHSCSAFALNKYFNAREFIAPDKSCPGTTPILYNKAFWGRLDGTIDSGSKRNVLDAYIAAFKGSIFKHASKDNGKTVLSPAVANVSPTNSVTVGATITAFIKFDAAVSKSFASKAITLGGTCQPELINVRYQDDYTLLYTFRAKQPGNMTITVNNIFVNSADNKTALDGNQKPGGSIHVGPNRDDYIWSVDCVALDPSPTVGVSIATKEPTSTPTATPTPTSVPDPFAGISLSISATDGAGNTKYEIKFDDPILQSQRDTYTYSWQLNLPSGDDCGSNSGPFVIDKDKRWLGSWLHPGCDHASGEQIIVKISKDGKTVTIKGPSLGPKTVTP